MVSTTDGSGRPRLLIGLAFGAFVAWRGLSAAVGLAQEARSLDLGRMQAALQAPLEERIANSLGRAYPVFDAVRRHAGAVPVVFVCGDERDELAHLVASSLRHLAFPLRVVPVAMPTASQIEAIGGRGDALVLELRAVSNPAWSTTLSALESGAGFTLWRPRGGAVEAGSEGAQRSGSGEPGRKDG